MLPLILLFLPATLVLKVLMGGNALEFCSEIVQAFARKDNRTFCRYLCPIPAVFKLSSRFALFRVADKDESCIDCHACAQTCPFWCDW